MRVFLDTNVLVSAFTARGLSADLFRYVLAEHQVQTGVVNLTELRRILADRFHAAPWQLNLVEGQLRAQIVIPRPAAPAPVTCRDPDDKWVLASAIDGNAQVLVTGDKDLLVLNGKLPFPIVTPREAWESLRTLREPDG